MNHRIRTIGAWAVCICMLISCGCKKETIVSPGNRLFTYPLQTEPTSLDPQAVSGEDAYTVVCNLFEGLCRRKGDGSALPGVAQSWTASADGTVYTFSLREAQWSDGTPVTAADFLFGMRRALEPKTHCPSAAALFKIVGAEAYYRGEGEWNDVGIAMTDASTLIITLTEADPSFPAQTAQSAFMPCNEAFFKSTDGKYGMETAQILCNGPFVPRKKSAWMHGEYIRLVRNTQYIGESEPLPSGLMFKIGASQTATDDVLNGTVNLSPIPDSDANRAQLAGLQVVPYAESTWGLLFRCDVLDNASVRGALIASLTRTALMEQYPDSTANTVNVLPGALRWHGAPYRSQVKNCAAPSWTSSPAELLAAGLAESGRKTLPELTVLCTDTRENRQLMNQMLTDWRQTLGCYINIETVADEATLQSRVSAGKYQIALVGIQAKENNAEAFLNQLLTDAAYESETWTAPEAPTLSDFYALETELIENGVFYPLYARNRCYALGATVTGVEIQPFGGGIDFCKAGRY